MSLMLLHATPTEPEEYAVRCNTLGCDLEVKGATQEEALDNAACAGFKFEPNGGSQHVCPQCQAGTSRAAQAAMNQMAQVAAQQQGMTSFPSLGDGGDPDDPTGWLN